jgi:threonine/homoserine/homoserine lactone efflux protein
VHGLASYLAVAVFVIVTPGPDTAVTVRNALLGGRRSGIFTAAGVATGQLAWTLAASAGVTALLLASERVFQVLKWAGAAYLVVLGCQALRAAVQGFDAPAPGAPSPGSRARSASRAYRQGLISDLGSPKMAAFFTSLLPQFAPGPNPSFAVMVGLGALFCALTLLWLALYSTVVDRAAAFLNRPAVRRWMESVTGLVLIGLGLRVATESRPS